MSRQQRRFSERAQRKANKQGAKSTRTGTAISSGAALTLGIGLCLGQPTEAHAAPFLVSNLNDAGTGSLRQAVIDANAAGGADDIYFSPGLSGTITLVTGEILITDDVDIHGPGAGVLAVSGNNASRIFLLSGAGVLDTKISGLTLTNGSEVDGGAIYDDDEKLTLDGMVIRNNRASDDGGGLWAEGADISLTISNSQITGNHAHSEGGGAYLYAIDGPILIEETQITGNTAEGSDGGGLHLYDVNGTVTIRDSEISGNTSHSDGGGIYSQSNPSTMLIQRTRITGNHAGSDGGGIYFYHSGDVTIEACTISGNSANSDGGGLYLYDTSTGKTLTVRDTTISGNSADDGGGAYFYDPDDPIVFENCTISGNHATSGSGGGIYARYFDKGEIELRHTTIAGNTATDEGGGVYLYDTDNIIVDQTIIGDNMAPTNNDIGGSGRFDARYSLIEDPGSANVNDIVGNIFGRDPHLAPLANYGGPTETQALLSGSPAVNAGDPAFIPPPNFDQRGPGFPRVLYGRIDIGAYEGIFVPAAAPALGRAAQFLVSGLLAVFGFRRLRRRRVIAPVLLLGLALGVTSADAAQNRVAAASTVSTVQVDGNRVILRTSNGQSVDAPMELVKIKDKRHAGGAAPATIGTIQSGQPIVLKVKRLRNGTLKKVKVVLYDSLTDAGKALAND